MAELNKESWKDTAKGVGVLGAIICALAGFAANKWGGAIVGGISGYFAGYLLIFIFVFIIDSIKVIVGLAIVLFIAVLLFSSNILRIQEATTKQSFSSQTGRNLSFFNACHKSVELFLWWKGTSEQWMIDGPWTVAGNSSIFPGTRNGTRLELHNNEAYFYARIPGENYEWSGNIEGTMNGTKYKMRKEVLSTDNHGNYTFSIGCPNLG